MLEGQGHSALPTPFISHVGTLIVSLPTSAPQALLEEGLCFQAPSLLTDAVCIGRNAELDEVQRRLNASPFSFVVLSGLPGIGKTHLARQIFYESLCPHKLWFDASSPHRLRKQLRAFARVHRSHNPSLRASHLKAFFENLSEPLLLILDNASCLSDMDFLPVRGKVHIVVTSRQTAWNPETLFSMKAMTEKDALQLARSFFPTGERAPREDQLRRLLDETGLIPEAIAFKAKQAALSGDFSPLEPGAWKNVSLYTFWMRLPPLARTMLIAYQPLKTREAVKHALSSLHLEESVFDETSALLKRFHLLETPLPSFIIGQASAFSPAPPSPTPSVSSTEEEGILAFHLGDLMQTGQTGTHIDAASRVTLRGLRVDQAPTGVLHAAAEVSDEMLRRLQLTTRGSGEVSVDLVSLGTLHDEPKTAPPPLPVAVPVMMPSLPPAAAGVASTPGAASLAPIKPDLHPVEALMAVQKQVEPSLVALAEWAKTHPQSSETERNAALALHQFISALNHFVKIDLRALLSLPLASQQDTMKRQVQMCLAECKAGAQLFRRYVSHAESTAPWAHFDHCLQRLLSLSPSPPAPDFAAQSYDLSQDFPKGETKTRFIAFLRQLRADMERLEMGRAMPVAFSYAWPVIGVTYEHWVQEAFLSELRTYLMEVGLPAAQDITDSVTGGITAYQRSTYRDEDTFILVFGTPSFRKKLDSEAGHVIAAELNIVLERFRDPRLKNQTMPISLFPQVDQFKYLFPDDFPRQIVIHPWKKQFFYQNFMSLIKTIRGIAPDDGRYSTFWVPWFKLEREEAAARATASAGIAAPPLAAHIFLPELGAGGGSATSIAEFLTTGQ